MDQTTAAVLATAAFNLCSALLGFVVQRQLARYRRRPKPPRGRARRRTEAATPH